MPSHNSTTDNFFSDTFSIGASLSENIISAINSSVAGMNAYSKDFFIPFIHATSYFHQVEKERFHNEDISDSVDEYLDLFKSNIDLAQRSISGTSAMMTQYTKIEMDDFIEAVRETCTQFKFDRLSNFIQRQASLLKMVTTGYPEAIDAIEPEYGFHFERGDHPLIHETDRFLLYRVAPSLKQVKMQPGLKPVLIIPPYVLGSNILGFLPGEERSYAHCFANLGFPTYIRVLKDIKTSPALQTMTGEDDAMDTRTFCEIIFKEHGKPVTLNGYCQGGYNALCTLLTGELDSLVDAFVTCVSPIDGTRSRGLAAFLKNLPPRFNDLSYGTKTLPNGNKVADGNLMGWVYKLKSIEQEIPAALFFRDLAMFARQKNGNFEVGKTAAALNYWLQNERNDLPLEITRMSFASYNTPISREGVLPVRLMDRELNLNRLKEKNIPWLICYGIHDDLVEKETSLAALDFVPAEVTPFPKGHVAIATSWSSPGSACALHTRFGEGQYRGPVRFHMDLDQSLSKKKKATNSKTIKAASQKNTKESTARKASPKERPRAKSNLKNKDKR